MKQAWTKVKRVMNAIYNYYMKSLRFSLAVALPVGYIVFTIVMFNVVEEQKITVPEKAVLKMDLKGQIVEQKAGVDGTESIIASLAGQGSAQTSIYDILKPLKQAATDPRIQGLVISTKDLTSISSVHITMLRDGIKELREAGKMVISYDDYYSQRSYHIASAADRVYLNPFGNLILEGLSMSREFYKDFHKKYGIDYTIYRVGTYKSAVEPYLRSDISPEARQVSKDYLDDVWAEIRSDIATSRGIAPEAVDSYIDDVVTNLEQVGGDFAKLAHEKKLVDGLLSRDAFQASLKESFPSAVDQDEEKAKEKLQTISLADYAKAEKPSETKDDIETEEPAEKNLIATVLAEGTIFDGEQAAGSIGSDSLSQLIKKARDTDNVKAIVLRLNSPGGSAFASEVIRQEILATTAQGNPVVVSMGSLAASGGYWIAAGADKILAYPNTLTGSIGVFAVARGFKTLANEHGITEDNVSTHALTKDLGFLNPRNAQIDAIRTLSVKNTYGKYLGLVSEGRDIPLDKVDAMAQGRILSGKKALELGLVDELGGYQDAIDAAAKLANLDSYEEQRIQREKTFEEILISKLSEVESQSKLLSQLSALEAVLSFIKPEVAKATDPLGINQTFVDCLCLPQ